MNFIDVIILAVLGYFVFAGLRKGLIRELFDLTGVILAFLVAIHQMSTLTGLLATFIPLPTTILTVISFLILFVIVDAGMMFAGRVVRKAVQIILMGWADAAGGAVSGLVKGALFVSIFLYLIYLIPYPNRLFTKMDQALLVRPLKTVAPMVFNGVTAILPGVKSFYGQFKDSVASKKGVDFDEMVRRSKQVNRFFSTVSGRKD